MNGGHVQHCGSPAEVLSEVEPRDDVSVEEQDGHQTPVKGGNVSADLPNLHTVSVLLITVCMSMLLCVLRMSPQWSRHRHSLIQRRC